MNLYIKIIISFFLCFHLLAVILSPNPTSILSEDLSFITRGYAGTLGIMTPWKFFAPNPGLNRVLEIELFNEGSDITGQGEVIYWPPKDRSPFFHGNYMRRFYHSILTSMSVERSEKYFKPYLCRAYPQLEAFSLKVKYVSIPDVRRAKLEDPHHIEDILKESDVPVLQLECDRTSEAL